MATRKAGGTAKNLRDSQPKYLGVKRTHGSKVGPGEVLVRQRGTKIMPGRNVGVGKDHTIFSLKEGVVAFGERRKVGYDGKVSRKKEVSVK